MTPARRLKRKLGAVIAALSLTLSLAACSSSSEPTVNESGRGEVLNMQFRGSPISLDPAYQGTASGSVFTVLAYDPLIYKTPAGDLVPDLATEWAFVDDAMKVFELKLREGVKFHSGTELDAAAVKASMDYFLKAGGGLVGKVGKIASIDVVDDMTLRINYDEPFPKAASTLTQYMMFGNIIGPDGLANPESLKTSMDGTGQYIYNREESVPDSVYVYDRNPNYWAPEAQMYEKAKIHVMGDPNTVLSAATTGQVDFAIGTPGLVSAAKSNGLDIVTAPFYHWSLVIMDPEGAVNPALANQKVRQAMSLAIDREATVQAYGPEYATIGRQFVGEGAGGYIENFGAEYDLDKAKSLMKEAGYEDGFSMTILANSIMDNQLTITQAVVDGLKKIGIDVTLNVESVNLSAFVEAAKSKAYEAAVGPGDGTDAGEMYAGFRNNPVTNAFNTYDPEMEELYKRSLTATADESPAIYEDMTRRMHEIAWTIPVFTQHIVNYVGPSLTNVSASVKNPIAMPVGPAPEYSWQPKK